MSKLFIAIISENMKRSDRVLDFLEQKESYNVIKRYKTRQELVTNDAIYKAYNINRIDGVRADQVIFDYALDKEKAFAILTLSCVPKELQIIDDRKVLN